MAVPTAPSSPPAAPDTGTAGAAAVPRYADLDALRRQDPLIAEVILGEAARQAGTVQLIAAENFTSPAVLAALGSPLANKYAEGYPGARHHGGCERVDTAERIARERATALFGADHANVQPHSGSAAVLAVYAALLRPGDGVLALSLDRGGHLTHGSPANFSGRWYDFTGYGVDPVTGRTDPGELRRLAREHRPRAIVCGSICDPRHPDYALFREVADEVGAWLIVDAAHPLGLVAGGAAPSPVPYADVVCATTHKVLRGPRGGMILCGRSLAERIDRAVFPFSQGGAQMHTIAAKAVAFGEASTPAFAGYAHRVVANARVLAGALAAEGFTVVTGGTDTHLLVVDPAPLGVDGRTARSRLAAAGLIADVCGLPSGTGRGVRIGTAAVTTQGMGEGEMARIAALFARAVREDGGRAGASVGSGGGGGAVGTGGAGGVRAQVHDLAGRFPPYP
ncbi:serine hydroxymethyltransferase [Streptomyces sp. NPDC000594]|uniref:serine hydroxymethyltransferase n=1 Tax=Streptomyces sp. NPDC000594 TaxID=3154261 RepID=UPI00331922EE